MIDDPDATPELHELLRFTLTCTGLGIPPERVAGDFRSGLGARNARSQPSQFCN